ncbi:MAG: hypothetical protein KJ607_09370, partial [Bacteroidetes bacterium]|nr:hypothetical protein [Bacteroidota bacterium]
MKTIISLFVLAISLICHHVSAQQLPLLNEAQQSCFSAGIADYITGNVSSQKVAKATGDTIWYEGFSSCTLPSGWTLVDNTGNGFDWIVTDQPPGGVYSASAGIIESSSGGCFMQFRADYYNSPLPPVPVDMDAYFQTSAINCSGYAAVILRFEQYLRWCCQNNEPFKVMVSNDGFTWTTFYAKGDNQVNAASPNPETVEFNITSIAANQPAVYLRFYMSEASHYFWMIDDILLYEAPQYNMVLEQQYANFRYTNGGFYSRIPQSQATWAWFKGALLNNGALPMTNVSLNVTVTDSLGAVFFNENKDISQISSVSRDTLELDSAFVCTGLNKGMYTASYEVAADETDQIPEDNTASLEFEITDSVMAHDQVYTGKVAPSMYVGAIDGDLIGCMYWLDFDDTVNSVSVFIHSSTTVGTPVIKAEIWRYDSGLGDWILVIDSEEHVIAPEDPGNWITLKLTSDDGLQEYLTGGYSYAAMINCTWGSDTLWFGADGSPGFHDYQMESSLRNGGTWYYLNTIPQVRMNMYRSALQVLSASISNYHNVTCFGAND